ncbi:MAG: cold shock domain-containing protein [Hydrogenophaga sp.]|nr:cold shock domain-containing protein [Hydrogenophaga sp.]
MNATNIRFNGQLKKWNDDRGFGFVVAEHGDQLIFVHVSTFPRDGRLPTVGEPLSFEIELDKDGRKRAARVRRPGAEQQAQSRRDERAMPSGRRAPRRAESSPFAARFITFLIVAGLDWYAYAQYSERVAPAPAAPQGLIGAPAPEAAQSAPSAFQCDGRQHCSQMTSCREAKLFLKNCPGMKMDGDGDGIPCEEQLCNGAFGG